ncbi:MAG TPA: histidine kinase [Candidatus Eisenbacteria bacterium]|nr:histidine kinase [Candidatus Eisenbacteria bacterium]
MSGENRHPEDNLALAIRKVEQTLKVLSGAASSCGDVELAGAVRELGESLAEARSAVGALSPQVRRGGMGLEAQIGAITPAQLRALYRRQQGSEERQRAELARELHDQLGSALTAFKLDLHWVMARIPMGIDAVRERLSGMAQLVDRTVESVARLEARLRPRLLADFGLIAAIEWQAQEFERRTGIRCRADLPQPVELDRQLSIALFRIFEEALSRIARDSNATEVTVTLRLEGGDILLEVEDNGACSGRDRSSEDASTGLLRMEERAFAFGGNLELVAKPEEGRRMILKMPATPEVP